jgi:hypothetical protein
MRATDTSNSHDSSFHYRKSYRFRTKLKLFSNCSHVANLLYNQGSTSSHSMILGLLRGTASLKLHTYQSGTKIGCLSKSRSFLIQLTPSFHGP